MELEDPFDYKKPDWLVEKEREKRRAARSRRLGRPIGEWGGRRKGAGRKRERQYDHMVGINVNRVQEQILRDMGNGDLSAGVIALINEHL